MIEKELLWFQWAIDAKARACTSQGTHELSVIQGKNAASTH